MNGLGRWLRCPDNCFNLNEPAPANGDGRSLKATDGAELLIYGGYSSKVVTESFAEYKRYLVDEGRKEGRKVTYSAEGKDWIVLSGT